MTPRPDKSKARRRQPTPREVLIIVMQQVRVRDGRSVLMCPLCGEPIWEADWPNVIREHLVALELGGEDTPANQAFVHKKCADEKTTGRAGESDLSISGNGDNSRIAKVKRITGETCTGPKRKIPAPANPWPPKGSQKLATHSDPWGRKWRERRRA